MQRMIEHQAEPEKKRMLFLSHVLPDPTGNWHEARTWQWLKVASTVHDIDLFCMVKGNTHYQQWLRVNQLATPVLVTKRRFFGKAAPHQLIDANDAYDLCFASHVDLIRWMERTQSARRVVDIATSTAMLQTAAHSRNRKTRRAMELLRNEVDLIATDHRGEQSLPKSALSRLAVVPTCIDFTGMTHEAGNASGDQTLIHQNPPRLYVDANSIEGRRWFKHRVLPVIRQMVPDCVVEAGSPQRSFAGRSTRPNAGDVVVAIPDRDSREGVWSAYRALAQEQALVADAKTLTTTSAKHGEHLLLSRSIEEWAGNCVQALQSTTLRMGLALRGRQWIEQARNLARTSDRVIEALTGRPLALNVGMRTAA